MLALVLAAVYRRWGVLLLTAVAILLADAAAVVVKALVDRPRPFVRYPEPKILVPRPHDASFPSGHAATSFAAATILSFAFPKAAPAFLVLAAAVAYSRVYVGVHYPLDVIGGAALGALVAIALLRLVRARPRLPRVRRTG
ncbi:MAG TPA: phosphatase PAP2 family protein [Gaiellaceae bacterium]